VVVRRHPEETLLTINNKIEKLEFM
jgi:hypothetical protein